MTVQRSNGAVGFSCDECPMTVEPEEPDFNDAWAEAKRQGWRSEKSSRGEWEHFCPDCARNRR